MSHLFQINSSGEPTLGCGFDTNNHNISNSNTNGDVSILPNGSGKVVLDASSGDKTTSGVSVSDGLIEVRTGTGSVADIRMYCEVSNAHYVSLNAPAHSSFSGNVNFTLPASNGTNGQVLQTNGSGVTSWVDQSGSGGGGSLPQVNDVTEKNTGTHAYTISDSVTGIESTFLINYTSSGSTITVYLPDVSAASVSSGYKINIKRLTSEAVTISRSNGTSQLIDNSISLALPHQYSAVTVQTDGSNWWII
jgi:hypothetical protein